MINMIIVIYLFEIGGIVYINKKILNLLPNSQT